MNTMNFAHRGFSSCYPENTMEAFQAAYESGSDGIELDVQLTRDGEVVIFHDATFDRLTNTTGALSEFTASEISDIQIPFYTSAGFENYSIPMLDDYLKWVKDKDILTNIEMKSITSENFGLEKKVLQAIFDYGLEEKVLISSFHKNHLLRVKRLVPIMKIGLLTPGCNRKILGLAKALECDYIHPHYTSLTRKLVNEAKRLDLKMNVWTVNDYDTLEKMKELELDGVITDRPDLFKTIQSQALTFV